MMHHLHDICFVTGDNWFLLKGHSRTAKQNTARNGWIFHYRETSIKTTLGTIIMWSLYTGGLYRQIQYPGDKYNVVSKSRWSLYIQVVFRAGLTVLVPNRISSDNNNNNN